MLAVNDGDSVKQIRDYFEKEKFTFRPLRQKESATTEAYGVEAFPTNYVIDKDGKIVAGSLGWNEEKIRAALEKLLPEK